jgi:amidase
MTDDSLVFRPASELAALIRGGQVTAVQVAQAHLGQIRRFNEAIHAVTHLVEDRALADAEAADRRQAAGEALGPLHGVPMTLKDSLRVRGLRSTFGGLPLFLWHEPKTDSTLAGRLRKSGAIFLGRTNLPLMALDWQCRNPFFKEGKNPWDAARTPGGSSGGAAAAVAAGFTPFELGSDLGGSIRYPAHCCGVLGLRTTDGLLPGSDIGPESLKTAFPHLVSLGPMARTLGDLALLLDVLTDAPAPTASLTTDGAPRPLRIAITRLYPGAQPSRETLALIDSLTESLRRDGHTVQVGPGPNIPDEDAWRIWGTIAGHIMWGNVPWILRGRIMRALFAAYMLRRNLGSGPFTTWFSVGMRASEAEYQAAIAERQTLLATIDSYFAQNDLWILPVAMGEAIVRQPRGDDIVVDGQPVPYSRYLGAYTVPTTAYGTPVLTAPIGYADSGLPIGVQIHAARFADRRLLQLAEQALSKYIQVRKPPLVAASAAG